MNYLVPVISTIISIIGIKKKYNYPALVLLITGMNFLVWPNIPSTQNEYIYYLLSSIVATLIGYYISKIMN